MIDTTSIIIGLLFGSIGTGYCIYGRKRKNTLVFWIGVALIGLPYIIESNIWVVVISVALMILPRYLK